METPTIPTPLALPKISSLPYVVCVEGNIGSGKSTLLSCLASQGYTVIPEPIIDIWGQYLPQLYQDTNRWGFCFQMEVVDWFRQLQSKKFKVHLSQEINIKSSRDLLSPNSRLKVKNLNSKKIEKELNSNDDDDKLIDNINNDDKIVVEDINNTVVNDQHNCEQKEPEIEEEEEEQNSLKKNIIIVERSALSSIEIFSRNLLADNNMSEWEFSLLQRFYSLINWQSKYVLYLRCEPEISYQRIQKRNRDGEHKVNVELIRSLHNRHETLYAVNNQTSTNIQKSEDNNQIHDTTNSQTVIIVDGTKDAVSVVKQALQEIDRLEASFN
jgi:deoxyadenosine/deoxycytidine kinase